MIFEYIGINKDIEGIIVDYIYPRCYKCKICGGYHTTSASSEEVRNIKDYNKWR